MPAAERSNWNRCPFPLPSNQNSASRPQTFSSFANLTARWTFFRMKLRTSPMMANVQRLKEETHGPLSWTIGCRRHPQVVPWCGKMKFSPNPRMRGSSYGNILRLQVVHDELDEMDLTQRIVECVSRLVSGKIQAVLAIRYCQLISLQHFVLLVQRVMVTQIWVYLRPRAR